MTDNITVSVETFNDMLQTIKEMREIIQKRNAGIEKRSQNLRYGREPKRVLKKHETDLEYLSHLIEARREEHNRHEAAMRSICDDFRTIIANVNKEASMKHIAAALKCEEHILHTMRKSFKKQ